MDDDDNYFICLYYQDADFLPSHGVSKIYFVFVRERELRYSSALQLQSVFTCLYLLVSIRRLRLCRIYCFRLFTVFSLFLVIRYFSETSRGRPASPLTTNGFLWLSVALLRARSSESASLVQSSNVLLSNTVDTRSFIAVMQGTVRSKYIY